MSHRDVSLKCEQLLSDIRPVIKGVTEAIKPRAGARIPFDQLSVTVARWQGSRKNLSGIEVLDVFSTLSATLFESRKALRSGSLADVASLYEALVLIFSQTTITDVQFPESPRSLRVFMKSLPVTQVMDALANVSRSLQVFFRPANFCVCPLCHPVTALQAESIGLPSLTIAALQGLASNIPLASTTHGQALFCALDALIGFLPFTPTARSQGSHLLSQLIIGFFVKSTVSLVSETLVHLSSAGTTLLLSPQAKQLLSEQLRERVEQDSESGYSDVQKLALIASAFKYGSQRDDIVRQIATQLPYLDASARHFAWHVVEAVASQHPDVIVELHTSLLSVDERFCWPKCVQPVCGVMTAIIAGLPATSLRFIPSILTKVSSAMKILSIQHTCTMNEALPALTAALQLPARFPIPTSQAEVTALAYLDCIAVIPAEAESLLRDDEGVFASIQAITVSLCGAMKQNSSRGMDPFAATFHIHAHALFHKPLSNSIGKENTVECLITSTMFMAHIAVHWQRLGYVGPVFASFLRNLSAKTGGDLQQLASMSRQLAERAGVDFSTKVVFPSLFESVAQLAFSKSDDLSATPTPQPDSPRAGSGAGLPKATQPPVATPELSPTPELVDPSVLVKKTLMTVQSDQPAPIVYKALSTCTSSVLAVVGPDLPLDGALIEQMSSALAQWKGNGQAQEPVPRLSPSAALPISRVRLVWLKFAFETSQRCSCLSLDSVETLKLLRLVASDCLCGRDISPPARQRGADSAHTTGSQAWYTILATVLDNYVSFFLLATESSKMRPLLTLVTLAVIALAGDSPDLVALPAFHSALNRVASAFGLFPDSDRQLNSSDLSAVLETPGTRMQAIARAGWAALSSCPESASRLLLFLPRSVIVSVLVPEWAASRSASPQRHNLNSLGKAASSFLLQSAESPGVQLLRANLLYSFVFECTPAPLISAEALKAALAANHRVCPEQVTNDEAPPADWLERDEVAQFLVRVFCSAVQTTYSATSIAGAAAAAFLSTALQGLTLPQNPSKALLVEVILLLRELHKVILRSAAAAACPHVMATPWTLDYGLSVTASAAATAFSHVSRLTCQAFGRDGLSSLPEASFVFQHTPASTIPSALRDGLWASDSLPLAIATLLSWLPNSKAAFRCAQWLCGLPIDRISRLLNIQYKSQAQALVVVPKFSRARSASLSGCSQIPQITGEETPREMAWTRAQLLFKRVNTKTTLQDLSDGTLPLLALQLPSVPARAESTQRAALLVSHMVSNGSHTPALSLQLGIDVFASAVRAYEQGTPLAVQLITDARDLLVKHHSSLQAESQVWRAAGELLMSLCEKWVRTPDTELRSTPIVTFLREVLKYCPDFELDTSFLPAAGPTAPSDLVRMVAQELSFTLQPAAPAPLDTTQYRKQILVASSVCSPASLFTPDSRAAVLLALSQSCFQRLAMDRPTIAAKLDFTLPLFSEDSVQPQEDDAKDEGKCDKGGVNADPNQEYAPRTQGITRARPDTDLERLGRALALARLDEALTRATAALLMRDTGAHVTDTKTLTQLCTEQSSQTTAPIAAQAGRLALRLPLALVLMRQQSVLLPFSLRRAYLASVLASRPPTQRLEVNRDTLLCDALTCVMALSPEQRAAEWRLSFEGEAGLDVRGVRQDFIVRVSEQLLPLFRQTGAGAVCPAPLGSEKDEYLRQRGVTANQVRVFELLGVILGRSLREGMLTRLPLAAFVWKQLLNLPLSYHDVADADPSCYQQRILFIRDTECIENVLPGTAFTFEGPDGEAELCAGGANRFLDSSNKSEYVRLVAEYVLAAQTRDIVAAIRRGLLSTVPLQELRWFSPYELVSLTSGISIDIDDLVASIRPLRFCQSEDPLAQRATPQWTQFEAALRGLSESDLTLFVRFVTGAPSSPVGGFITLSPPFTVQLLNEGSEGRLPSSSTCFNLLKLPRWHSPEELSTRLRVALHESGESIHLC